MRAQVGYGPNGSNPDGNSAWTWVEMEFNTNVGNNDEFRGQLLPGMVGVFDHYEVFRSGMSGRPYDRIANTPADTTEYADLTVAGGKMTRLDLTHAAVTLTFLEGEPPEYKYTRGSRSSVESHL